MKLSLSLFVATIAKPTLYHRSAVTQQLMDQLVEIVPGIDFGDVDAHLTASMDMLTPLPNDELIEMMDEMDDFLKSILAVVLLYLDY